MYTHILVATDLSKSSKSLLTKSEDIAKQFHAKLSVIHVIEPIPSYGYPGFADLSEISIEHAEEGLADACEVIGLSPKDQYVKAGTTKSEVIHLAEKIKADLILVGSHSPHGLTHLLGSTANAILHNAHCDVLTVRVEKK